jgi:hypothetical protein
VCVIWVTKVAIVSIASNKPEQAGEFGKPDWRVRITEPTNSGQWARRLTASSTRSPKQVYQLKTQQAGTSHATEETRTHKREQPNRVSE